MHQCDEARNQIICHSTDCRVALPLSQWFDWCMPVILTLFSSILILWFEILCHYRSKDMHSAIAVNWQCCNICIMQCRVSLLPVIWLCRGVVIPYTIVRSINILLFSRSAARCCVLRSSFARDFLLLSWLLIFCLFCRIRTVVHFLQSPYVFRYWQRMFGVISFFSPFSAYCCFCLVRFALFLVGILQMFVQKQLFMAHSH